MRLWHKDLIPVLPRKQLLSQWRECCCIARNINVNGTPNHILVNKILEYPLNHFYTYTGKIFKEMLKRGYRAKWSKAAKYFPKWFNIVEDKEIFKDWHNDRYLIQCYFNLQEKYDCGGISFEEWEKIENYMTKELMLI